MANFQLIKEIAKKKNIPIRQLAGDIGISESQLHHIVKSGKTNTQTLESIAARLDEPVSTFFDGCRGAGDESLRRIKELENEVVHLRELLREKERTINILMK